MAGRHLSSLWDSLIPIFSGTVGRAIATAATAVPSISRSSPFEPKYEDVCVVRAMLKSQGLPTELVLEILDYARYWPSFEFTMPPNTTAVAHASIGSTSCATLCLQADVFKDARLGRLATCQEKVKIKEIEFEIESCDQGWTSEGTQFTFDTSSWTEVSILRGTPTQIRSSDEREWLNTRWDNPLSFNALMRSRGWSLVTRPSHLEYGPQGGEGDLAWYVQGNRVAKGGPEDYRVVWGKDRFIGNDGARDGEGFLDELKEGDRVLIWARAKWPGWACLVYSVTMKVSYGF